MKYLKAEKRKTEYYFLIEVRPNEYREVRRPVLDQGNQPLPGEFTTEKVLLKEGIFEEFTFGLDVPVEEGIKQIKLLLKNKYRTGPAEVLPQQGQDIEL